MTELSLSPENFGLIRAQIGRSWPERGTRINMVRTALGLLAIGVSRGYSYDDDPKDLTARLLVVQKGLVTAEQHFATADGGQRDVKPIKVNVRFWPILGVDAFDERTQQSDNPDLGTEEQQHFDAIVQFVTQLGGADDDPLRNPDALLNLRNMIDNGHEFHPAVAAALAQASVYHEQI